jgi:hypothetical protein
MTVKMNKPWKIRWMGNVDCTAKNKYAYNVSAGKLEIKIWKSWVNMRILVFPILISFYKNLRNFYCLKD